MSSKEEIICGSFIRKILRPKYYIISIFISSTSRYTKSSVPAFPSHLLPH
jgi:hypothetical protein